MTLKKDSPFSQQGLIATGAIFVCPAQPTNQKQNLQGLVGECMSNEPFDPNAPETEEDGIKAGALRIAKYRYQAQQMRQRIPAKNTSDDLQPTEDTMTKSKQTSSARQFKITVNYGYDVHSIIVNQGDMDKIKNREAVTVQGQGFEIEGDTEDDDWSFHCTRPNSLEVQCEDGHQVFDGDLMDAIINEI